MIHSKTVTHPEYVFNRYRIPSGEPIVLDPPNVDTPEGCNSTSWEVQQFQETSGAYGSWVSILWRREVSKTTYTCPSDAAEVKERA